MTFVHISKGEAFSDREPIGPMLKEVEDWIYNTGYIMARAWNRLAAERPQRTWYIYIGDKPVPRERYRRVLITDSDSAHEFSLLMNEGIRDHWDPSKVAYQIREALRRAPVMNMEVADGDI